PLAVWRKAGIAILSWLPDRPKLLTVAVEPDVLWRKRSSDLINQGAIFRNAKVRNDEKGFELVGNQNRLATERQHACIAGLSHQRAIPDEEQVTRRVHRAVFRTERLLRRFVGK